jgi:hypothetical protein
MPESNKPSKPSVVRLSPIDPDHACRILPRSGFVWSGDFITNVPTWQILRGDTPPVHPDK